MILDDIAFVGTPTEPSAKAIEADCTRFNEDWVNSVSYFIIHIIYILARPAEDMCIPISTFSV